MRSYTSFAVLGLALQLALPCPAVTVYSQVPMKMQTASTARAASTTVGDTTYTGAAAYNPLVLAVPPVPSNLAQIISYALPAQVPAGASIKQRGDFYGFSIEMSVSNQTLGKNSTNINVPFLNLMANLVQRGGNVNVRVGGNTQERAEFVDFIPGGDILSKDYVHTTGRTGTPPITYTADLLYMMANVSTLVAVDWWLGLPFASLSPLNLDIMVVGERILGARLLGFQVGNEPDLYATGPHFRDAGYDAPAYFGEFGAAVANISANASVPVKDNLLAPSVASGNWPPEDVWNTGFLDAYNDTLKYLAVEHYPDNNCNAVYGGGTPAVPQEKLGGYLTHQAGQQIVAPYLNSTALAQRYSKPFIMFETNTASCGGFAGISNSYVSALWALDYGLTMAYSNFSGANLHVGGQSTFYNPFTPPPTNQSHFHQWTIGPVYYSMLVVAEALGQTGTAQVIDLYPQSVAQPNYAIYENGKPSKLVLFNYASDPTGAANYQFNTSIAGGSVPSQVAVKYLLAPTVTSKDNITWAGQTFGGDFASDGRLQGTLNVTTVQCDTGANTCLITVPAPGVALVFFNTNDAEINDGAATQGASTFATTTLHSKTKSGANTATIDPSVLATSNGSSAKDRKGQGATSKGDVKNGTCALGVPVAATLFIIAASVWGLV